jgi:hypothetical protein
MQNELTSFQCIDIMRFEIASFFSLGCEKCQTYKEKRSGFNEEEILNG